MADAARPEPASGTWRPRVTLLALFALFFLPVLGAVVLQVLAPGWIPFGGTTNRGELVHPPVGAGIEQVHFLDSAQPRSGDAVWILVHAGNAPCEVGCASALAAMRQARLALGKDAHRVARWWLVTREPAAGSVAAVLQAFPGTRVGIVSDVSALFADPSGTAPVQVVDPAGFLILRYRDADPAQALFKDLKRLLRVSGRG